MVYSQKDVERFGSILGVWAHPDDESWSSAGLMKMAALNGQRIGIITATKGDAGQSADEKKWPKAKLAEIREQELANCLGHIGEIEQYWLEYEDGKMAGADERVAVEQISEIIKLFKPTTVVTFEPNGITGHDDHRTISRWTTLAVKQTDSSIKILHSIESVEKHEEIGREFDSEFNVFFNTDKPNLINEDDGDIVLKLDGKILESKICCIKAHASQSSHMFVSENGNRAMRELAGTEIFVFVDS